jgi:hypothetical protein
MLEPLVWRKSLPVPASAGRIASMTSRLSELTTASAVRAASTSTSRSASVPWTGAMLSASTLAAGSFERTSPLTW